MKKGGLLLSLKKPSSFKICSKGKIIESLSMKITYNDDDKHNDMDIS